MDLAAALELSLKVLSDWRVIAIALVVILAWAALRYVGSVYRRRPPRAAMRGHSAPPPAPPASGQEDS